MIFFLIFVQPFSPPVQTLSQQVSSGYPIGDLFVCRLRKDDLLFSPRLTDHVERAREPLRGGVPDPLPSGRAHALASAFV